MKYLFYLIGLICLVSCGQEEQYRLLVIEEINRDKDFSKRKKVLCQYTMVDTGFVREVIYDEKTFYPYNHSIQPNDDRIINNRYLVRENGNHIYDLEVDSFVFQNDDYGFFVDLTDKQLLLTRNSKYFDDVSMFRTAGYDTLPPREFNGNYNSEFIAFDFELEKIIEVDSADILEYVQKGIYSPDKSKRAFSYYDEIEKLDVKSFYDTALVCMWSRNYFVNRRLSVLDVNNKEILNIPIGYVSNLWYQPKEPVLWIDNHRFITQQENNQLVLVNTETKKISKFAKIEDVNLCRLSKFETDVFGNHYFVVNDKWKIDIEKLQLEKVNKIPITNDLEKSFTINEGWRVIGDIDYFYKGKSILSDTTQTEHYDIIDNYLAIQCGEKTHTNNKDYSINIKVFDTKTEKLQTLKIKNMVGWIGWVKR